MLSQFIDSGVGMCITVAGNTFFYMDKTRTYVLLRLRTVVFATSYVTVYMTAYPSAYVIPSDKMMW